MATLTAPRKYLNGLYALVKMEFETASAAAGVDRVRELLFVANEQLRWGQLEAEPRDITVELSASLRARLLSLAHEVGNEWLADVHRDRARGIRVDHKREHEARSMLALHKHNR